MVVDFNKTACRKSTNKNLFGICDDQPPLHHGPAYIDFNNGQNWIAVVDNEPRFYVSFTAIDHCIDDMNRADGKPDKRCDGMLTFNQTVIFVELKEIDMNGAEWIRTAEEQLRSTVGFFENELIAETFKFKKAYIANSERPKFRNSQQARMEKFENETGYVLRIENRIIL